MFLALVCIQIDWASCTRKWFLSGRHCDSAISTHLPSDIDAFSPCITQKQQDVAESFEKGTDWINNIGGCQVAVFTSDCTMSLIGIFSPHLNLHLCFRTFLWRLECTLMENVASPSLVYSWRESWTRVHSRLFSALLLTPLGNKVTLMDFVHLGRIRCTCSEWPSTVLFPLRNELPPRVRNREGKKGF